LPHLLAASGGASGEKHPAIVLRMPDVRVGTDVMRGALSAVHEAKRGFAAVRNGESGLLGLGRAKNRRWTLDYQHDQIYIEPGAIMQPDPKIGIIAWFSQTAPGQPSILARTQVIGNDDLAKGLRLGDQLLSINGNSHFDAQTDAQTDAQGMESSWLALAQPVEVTLKIQRSGKALALKITPAELLPMNASTATLDDTPPHIP